MKMPFKKSVGFDLKEFIAEFSDTEEKRSESIQISIYIDDSACAELSALVRSSFASAAPNARITISYIGTAHAIADAQDDFAIIVAGTHQDVGRLADDVRQAGVPVMVVAADEQDTYRIALETGFAIPEGDVISPERGTAPEESEGQAAAQTQAHGLADEQKESLAVRMGTWVIEACPAKKLALASAFPFVRRPLALESVNATAVQNGGIGLLVFIPGADMPVMTLNQIKMVLQIATAYNQQINAERAKEIFAVCANAVFVRGIAHKLMAQVPVMGWLIRSGIGYGATIAVGRICIEYFENGAGVVGLGKTVNGVLATAMKVVSEASKEEEEPQPEKSFQEIAAENVDIWSGRAKVFAGALGKTAGPLAQAAAKVGADTFAQGMKQIIGR